MQSWRPTFDHRPLVCRGLADAIPRVLRLIRDEGQVVEVRGEPNREVLGVDIIIGDPTDRLPIVAGRRVVTAFCVVEFLWYAAVRNDLQSLEPYAPRIRSYYGGDDVVTGSNYGRAIFGARNGTRSQWENVVELLRFDTGSKRGFLGVFDACDTPTLLPSNHDVACTCGIQILIRGGELHWVTSMRANDGFRGFVSDTFSFTMMHELLANTLGIPLGQYVHRPTSLHTFPEDEASIDSILGAVVEAEVRERMPRVNPDHFWSGLYHFWAAHDRSLRAGDWRALANLEFDDEWWSWTVATILEFHGIAR
jgi:thymidylate synthase